MVYKITEPNLRKAVYEAVNRKLKTYQGLSFVDNILKEYPEFQDSAKTIIKTKRDGGKSLYKYLLNECGCASKYDKIAEYVDYKNEDRLLHDAPMHEYYDDPSQDYDLERDESEKYDYFEDPDGEYDEIPDEPVVGWEDEVWDGYEDDIERVEEAAGISGMPKYWVAEKDGRKKHSDCSLLDESIVKEEIKKIENEGYKVTAFRNKADMDEYLSN